MLSIGQFAWEEFKHSHALCNKVALYNESRKQKKMNEFNSMKDYYGRRSIFEYLDKRRKWLPQPTPQIAGENFIANARRNLLADLSEEQRTKKELWLRQVPDTPTFWYDPFIVRRNLLADLNEEESPQKVLRMMQVPDTSSFVNCDVAASKRIKPRVLFTDTDEEE